MPALQPKHNSPGSVLILHENNQIANRIQKAAELNGIDTSRIQDPNRELPPTDEYTQLLIVSSFKQLNSWDFSHSLPVLVVDAEATIARSVQAIKQGAFDYIPVSAQVAELASELKRVWQDFKTHLASKQQPQLTGKSNAINKAKKDILLYAKSNSHVLIEAPTGSETNVVAEEIHRLSSRSQKPFQTVNCAIRDKRTLLAMLYGESRMSIGAIESCADGSLYVEQLPHLTEHQYHRLFFTLKQFKVRLIASILPNLSEQQSNEIKGYFENPILSLPPLRERKEDIEPIARDILRMHASSPVMLNETSKEILMNHPWPSNYRELEQVIERALLVTKGQVIEPIAIALSSSEPALNAGISPKASSSLEDYFVNFVTQHELYLSETEIAARLGISRKSLWQRRQKLGIPRRYPRQ